MVPVNPRVVSMQNCCKRATCDTFKTDNMRPSSPLVLVAFLPNLPFAKRTQHISRIWSGSWGQGLTTCNILLVWGLKQEEKRCTIVVFRRHCRCFEAQERTCMFADMQSITLTTLPSNALLEHLFHVAKHGNQPTLWASGTNIYHLTLQRKEIRDQQRGNVDQLPNLAPSNQYTSCMHAAKKHARFFRYRQHRKQQLTDMLKSDIDSTHRADWAIRDDLTASWTDYRQAGCHSCYML